MSEPLPRDNASEQVGEGQDAGEYPVKPPAKLGPRWFSFRPAILDYLRPMGDVPRPGIQLALGFAGFCMSSGLMMVGFWSGSLGIGLGLVAAGFVMLGVLAWYGAKEPLIGYVIGLGLSPLTCCGLLSIVLR